MAEFKTVDDFLNYRSQEGGGGGKRLKSWAKSKGVLNFWLFTGMMPQTVWYHGLPELVLRTDKDTGRSLKNVWGRSHVCHEDESVLKKQRFRAADGTREHPPKSCHLCRLTEAVREMILDGDIADTDILFRWDGSDKPEENRVIHAGGLCSIWGREPKSEVADRLQKHGIYMSKVWNESAIAKLNYVLAGVDNDDVASGLQTAIQTQLVGDKIKATIRDQIASEGDKGNPFLNPYCLQLFYTPEAKKFDEKYGARRMNRFGITDEIERLIKGEPPNIAKFVTPFNPTEIRAMLEAHATDIGKRLPWDEIWKVPEPREVRETPEPEKQAIAHAPRTPEVRTQAPAAADYGDPCDDCKAPMLKTDTKCGKCGAVYADDAQPPPKAATAPATVPGVDDMDAVYDDEIPF
jgi:hypothetical protein